ncbi:putative ubiquitin-conjugating enzyme/RWD [Helianthus annuus]|nr:putative ubiquitin-conjugating enzyme/RWD [Helianthus annuus]
MMIGSSSSDGKMVIKLKISKLSDEDVTEDEESTVIGKRVFVECKKEFSSGKALGGHISGSGFHRLCGRQQLYILTEIKKYNEAIQLKSFETMAYIIKNPPKNFKAFVVGHFCDRAVDILRATNAYREGLQDTG